MLPQTKVLRQTLIQEPNSGVLSERARCSSDKLPTATTPDRCSTPLKMLRSTLHR